MFQIRRIAAALALTAAVTPQLAHAGEGSFGWVYTLDLQPKGTLEFEQRLQYNRQQVANTYNFWQSRSELEYGVTENFQIAGYLNASYTNAYRNYPATADYPKGETGGWGSIPATTSTASGGSRAPRSKPSTGSRTRWSTRSGSACTAR